MDQLTVRILKWWMETDINICVQSGQTLDVERMDNRMLGGGGDEWPRGQVSRRMEAARN